MNIEYIEDFIKVAEYQSLNQASKILNISTPALSKRIKSIEEYFESDLFYRTSRGIFLTENGEIVLNKFKRIKSDIDVLKAQILKNEDSTIRIGLLPSFSLYKWAEHKKEIISESLSIKIESNTHILLDHLHNGDIDVIIGDITATENSQLYSHILYREKYMVVFPITSNLRLSDNIFSSDLMDEQILLLNPPCDTLAFIQKNFSKTTINIEHKNDLESILANVKAEKGITIIPQSLITRVESMNLSIKELENHSREIGLIAYNEKIAQKVWNILHE
ncbi:LysR family transcriptional regulator [Staphylococcus ureilyticus]|uniref:LysR family transcriptional regulator n=1 Tax=Staphylococcus cohnii species complex TaxID=3239053 RepID=UPI00119E32BA|nr:MULTISPECIES: LysR family transcriptional regulator [Staphylococcus]MBZ8173167.1 LysR family transcriptional regulator [Staphylococcus cohnii]MDV3053135.1 LysR family transcriptional regulator [Staphylococcus ureilyticus]UXS60119.1 LysR family transcriptional regulator [Staphylococcus ureilyticus]